MIAVDPDKRVGLRERKKRKTREALQRAALRLFMKQGYEETTVEDIAAAAEVSPSTFFNYFPTKEDAVLYDAYDPIAFEMILKGPGNESLDMLARRVIERLGEAFEKDKELILNRARLVFEVPELRARMWEQMENTQEMLLLVLAKRTGRKPDDFELRIVVRSFIGAMYEVAMEWLRGNGRESLVTLTERGLDAMADAGRLTTGPSTGRARPNGLSRRRSLSPRSSSRSR
jgi:AcrR family transcriptional regulator